VVSVYWLFAEAESKSSKERDFGMIRIRHPPCLWDFSAWLLGG